MYKYMYLSSIEMVKQLRVTTEDTVYANNSPPVVSGRVESSTMLK